MSRTLAIKVTQDCNINTKYESFLNEFSQKIILECVEKSKKDTSFDRYIIAVGYFGLDGIDIYYYGNLDRQSSKCEVDFRLTDDNVIDVIKKYNEQNPKTPKS